MDNVYINITSRYCENHTIYIYIGICIYIYIYIGIYIYRNICVFDSATDYKRRVVPVRNQSIQSVRFVTQRRHRHHRRAPPSHMAARGSALACRSPLGAAHRIKLSWVELNRCCRTESIDTSINKAIDTSWIINKYILNNE